MAVWSVPKLVTELLEFFRSVLDSPGLIPGWKWSPCVKLWFGCCWAGNGQGFRFHKVEPMLGKRAAHGQPTTQFAWLDKKRPCVICIKKNCLK